MERRPGDGLLEILADDGALKEHRITALDAIADDEQRYLTQRRNGAEPVGLIVKVDDPALEGNTLLRQRDRSALDIGAEGVAGEDEVHDGLFQARRSRRGAAERAGGAEGEGAVADEHRVTEAAIRNAGYSQPPPAR